MDYKLGQIVHHLRYDYRAVVVGRDPQCQQDDDWYMRNQTQPDREQPWYHLFVEGGRETYAAQSSLEEDFTGEPVDHPYLRRLFPTFEDGRYYTHSLN